jgi:hypothetical protein
VRVAVYGAPPDEPTGELQMRMLLAATALLMATSASHADNEERPFGHDLSGWVKAKYLTPVKCNND